jgi:predicted RNA-binding protein with PIN domain
MYLVDGNNVIGQRGRGYENWWEDKAAARRQLLQDLAVLARVKKLRLTVVFDGSPDERFPDDARYRGVRILYAAPGSDADTRIVDYAENEKQKRALTVVTSDNQLAARVRVCGVQVMRAGTFRQMMEEAIDSAEATSAEPKVAPAKMPEKINEWMRYFGVSEEDDE